MLDLENFARRIRINILNTANEAGKKGAHIGPSLSLAEIFVVLFKGVACEQDAIILSKGHAALGLYAALYESGYITQEQLLSFEMDGSEFQTHPTKNHSIRIPASTGSLGMGLPYVCGLAYASKLKNESKRYYVILGDGECNEGSVWEAAMFASLNKLDNITVIVDCNGLAMDITTTWSYTVLPNIWAGFGWTTEIADGHDIADLRAKLGKITPGKPVAVLAKTCKGKGVSFMENAINWHHSVMSDEQFQNAIDEVTGNGI